MSKMEQTNARGKVTEIFAIMNMLSDKPKPPPQNLKKNAVGELLKSAEEVAKVWYDFLCKKFSCTQAETARPDMTPIPAD